MSLTIGFKLGALPIKYGGDWKVDLPFAVCFLLDMEIRRKLLNQMYRNPQLRKAVAFSIFVKSRTKSSTVHHWSVNKLHDITGVSAGAIRKRLAILRKLELIEEVGNKKRCLVFLSLKSHTSHRNAYIPTTDFISNTNLKKNAYAQEVKNIEKLLSVAIVIEIQKHKEYAKQMIQQSKHPKNLEELKVAKKACNRFGYGEKFQDNGISYSCIAKKLGSSLKTAFDIVKFAVEKEILTKTRNTRKRIFSNINYIQDMIKTNYTYIKNNIIYKVYANSYRFAGMV